MTSPSGKEESPHRFWEDPSYPMNKVRADRVELPTLYKYCPPEPYVLRSLESGHLYFGHPDDFNDPFEIRGDPGRWKHSDADEEKQWYESIKRTTRICCFSKTCDNLLMWTHYARGMTGFVVELDLKLALETNELTKIYCAEIEYRTSKELPKTNMIGVWDEDCYGDFREGTETTIQQMIFDLIFTKSDDFSYEKEWRLIYNYRANATDSPQRGLFLPYNAQGLKSVIFGMRASDKFIAETMKAVGNGPAFMQVSGTEGSSRLKLNPR